MRDETVFLEEVEERRPVFTDGCRSAADPFLTTITDFDEAEGGGTLRAVIARHRNLEARDRHEELGVLAVRATVDDQVEDYAITR